MTGDFHVLAVDHVQVTAPEELIDDTCAWYRTCLGLVEVEKPEGTRPKGSWFRAGDQEIHVSVDEHNPHKTAHFGMLVDDFEGVVEQLRGAGCHIEQAGAIPGRHRCYTRDPAGNKIEITQFDETRAATRYEEPGPAAPAGG
ncbi:MAG: VOC family protein [Actinomycetota bacterium]|nr:VOC family protein [Actinomycetota bacterium]